MNTRNLLLVGLLGFAPALAAEVNILVTPESLKNSWQVVGAGPGDIRPEGKGWILPAGVQVARELAEAQGATGVAVTFIGRPHFAAAAANMPALEFGDALVAFARSGDDGVLVVLIGENEPVVLPFAFLLDEAGRSAEPLQIRLGYDSFSKKFSVGLGEDTLSVSGTGRKRGQT